MAPLLAVIGAGGKTTALRCLLPHLTGQHVLLTTTTHIYPLAPPHTRLLLTDPTEPALLDALRVPGAVCAGRQAEDGKLSALPTALLEAARRTADLVLCEADGAHHLPLKLHRADEPVLPPQTNRCLIVAGLSAWGQPVAQAVHRYALHPRWAHDPALPVGAAEILLCIYETAAACGLPPRQVRILLNQADTLLSAAQGAALAERLTAEGFSCRAGSLQQEADALAAWILAGISAKD